MYAVIKSGGKQYRVEEGEQLAVELLDDARGPKVTGFTYKPKTNNRRRWGHRQRYSLIEITGISAGGAPRKAPAERKAPAKKAPTAKKTPATKKAPAKKRPPAKKR